MASPSIVKFEHRRPIKITSIPILSDLKPEMSRGRTKKACPPLYGPKSMRGPVINTGALRAVATALSILDNADESQKVEIKSLFSR